MAGEKLTAMEESVLRFADKNGRAFRPSVGGNISAAVERLLQRGLLQTETDNWTMHITDGGRQALKDHPHD